MSLVTQLSALVSRVGTEFKSVHTTTGDLVNLNTTAKDSLVSAINDVHAAVVAAAAVEAALINDVDVDTAHVFSSQKTTDLLVALKAEILDGAGTAFDTLNKLATLIGNDETGIANLVTLVGQKVDFTVAQTLSSVQQARARSNIDAASTGAITAESTARTAAITAEADARDAAIAAAKALSDAALADAVTTLNATDAAQAAAMVATNAVIDANAATAAAATALVATNMGDFLTDFVAMFEAAIV